MYIYFEVGSGKIRVGKLNILAKFIALAELAIKGAIVAKKNAVQAR